MRGDVFEVRTPQACGHAQHGKRFAVVVQATRFSQLSTWLVVPTSTRAQPAVFRPEIELPGMGPTRVLCEALTAVDPQHRLGRCVAYLGLADMQTIDLTLRGLLDLG